MIGGYIGSPIGGIVVLAENTITAIATITEASDTLTAASTVQIRASASLTEANDTLTAAGTSGIRATANLTEADDTATGSSFSPNIFDGTPTDADDTATGLILRGYFPISNRPITTRITKAQSTLPAHVTKQVSPATQITA